MKLMQSILLILASISFSSVSAQSQDAGILTDVEGYLNFELGRTPEIRKQRTIQVDETVCMEFGRGGVCSVGTIQSIMPASDALPMCAGNERCVTVKVDRVDIYTAPPSVANWQVIEISELILDEERMVRLPDNLYVKTVKGKNCSTVSDLPIGQTLKFSSTERVSHSVSRGVTSSATITARLTFKSPEGFGGSLGGSFTRGISLTNTEAHTTGRTISQSFDFRVRVAPRKLLTARAIVAETSLVIPFSGTILVDGNVDANLDGVGKISELLSPSARTLAVEGELSVTASTDVNTEQNDRDLTDRECANGDVDSSVVFEDFVLEDSENSILLSGLRQQGAAEVLAAERRNMRSATDLMHILGASGGLCYIGACNRPLDGYREYCYFDDDGFCTDCGEEPDIQCEPIE
ncbi:hypothetical protein [uncultured Litoreibacter sp.]|uniref:hypothetical protein n=1 Tax=uncultured Litoreibacter sp. TaxID=1392394 RepID=UPI00261FC449|nr:hypothetical protein [uncultured Litoreibacter sp.]